MTDSALRDLFHDAAPSLDGPDPAAIDRAWRDGSRRRVGTRVAVIASIAATAAAVTGVAVLDPGSPQSTPSGPSTSSPTSTPTSTDTGPPVAEQAGEHAGAEVWWAPSVMAETSLPPLTVAQLPAVIDIESAEVGAVGEPVVALLDRSGPEVFALTVSQRLVKLDLGRLAAVTDEQGNRISPISSYSLSPDQRRAFFVQESSLEVLDFVTGEWATVDTPDWLGEEVRWLMVDKIWVPTDLGEDSGGTVHPLSGDTFLTSHVDWVRGWLGPEDRPAGRVVAGRSGTVQAAFLEGPVPGGTVSNPEAIVVDQRGTRHVLAFDSGGPGETDRRATGCCSALGWLDEDTVLFDSVSTAGHRILAWDVGTGGVRLVSEVLGFVRIAQVADLS